MPSPVGHAIAGLTVHVLTARDETELLTPRRLGLAVLALRKDNPELGDRVLKAEARLVSGVAASVMKLGRKKAVEPA